MPARLLGFDRTLLWLVVAMLAFGLVMVYSASVAMPDNPKFARYAPTYFLVRHGASIAIAFMAGLSSWREVNRANSDAAITCMGTALSIAASTVQRPSPESSAYPRILSR